jgi:hypothetical protein
MTLSVDHLLSVAKTYWRPDKDYDFRIENSPETERFHRLWEQELKKMDQWRAFLGSIRGKLPGFIIGNATATCDSCFRCAAYPPTNQQRPSERQVIVGCLSILAPVYSVYGVRYEYSGKKLIGNEVYFEPFPAEMSSPATVIAKEIEATFGVLPLPRLIAETKIPLFVYPREPPNTTLFHALFISQPESVP